MRMQGRSVGSLTVVGTPTILEAAADRKDIPDQSAMVAVYSPLEKLDDGLPSISCLRCGSHHRLPLTRPGGVQPRRPISDHQQDLWPFREVEEVDRV